MKKQEYVTPKQEIVIWDTCPMTDLTGPSGGLTNGKEGDGEKIELAF